MDILLVSATLLGGISAIWFFIEKFWSSASDGLDLKLKPKTKARIKLAVPNEVIEKNNLKFGMLYVRDGKDQSDCRGFLLNQELWPEKANNALIFETYYTQSIGFQFKLFVDYKGYGFADIKSLLEGLGFSSVAQGEGKSARAWFISTKYEVCTTNDAITNNYYYPV